MIDEVLAALEKKQTILYPTDTVWGIGGDATAPEVVEKIYKIKQRADHKALIVLVKDIEMLKECFGIRIPTEPSCPKRLSARLIP